MAKLQIPAPLVAQNIDDPLSFQNRVLSSGISYRHVEVNRNQNHTKNHIPRPQKSPVNVKANYPSVYQRRWIHMCWSG